MASKPKYKFENHPITGRYTDTDGVIHYMVDDVEVSVDQFFDRLTEIHTVEHALLMAIAKGKLADYEHDRQALELRIRELERVIEIDGEHVLTEPRRNNLASCKQALNAVIPKIETLTKLIEHAS